MNGQLKGTIRMASVGQVTEDGQVCRWIEIALEIEVGSQKGKLVCKVLVPEKFLAKGETPMDHAVRAWELQDQAGKTKKIEDPKNFIESFLPLFLPGPLKDAKPLPKAEVESKLGKRQCDGVTGRLEFKYGKESLRVLMENRLHPDAPFGVVAGRWTLDSVGPETGQTIVRCNFKLIDLGEKATSEMPDADK
jgi:hypothetical protein